jgi:hypothetical protein
MMVVPLVSAKGDAAKSGSRPAVDATDGEYIVSPSTDNSLIAANSVSFALSTPIQYIIKGQTKVYNVYVGSGVSFLEVDLNWGDRSDSLTLSIYTPTGSKIGTYRDNSDGSVNGRIHLNIYPAKGYIGQGYWKFYSYGESVSGTEDYTFNAALH